MSVLIISPQAALSPRHALYVRALKRRGHKVTIILWDRDGSGEGVPSPGLEDCLWRWVSLKAPFWSPKIIFILPAYYYRVLALTSALDVKLGVLIITHLMLLPLALFIRGARVYDALEMFALNMSFYFGPFARLAFPLIRLVEGMLVKMMDGVATVDSKDGWLERYYRGWNRNVLMVSNYSSVHDDPGNGAVDAFRANYAGRYVIALVGGLYKDKGLMVALDAAAMVKQWAPEAQFLFIGTIAKEAEEVKDIVREKGIEDNVLFIPWMPYRTLVAHLGSAHIGLSLLQRAGIFNQVGAGNGRKMTTYMQAGIPIIGPEFGDAGKIVKQADCGLLVNTERAEAVCGAIKWLYENAAEAKRLGGNGRRAFEDKYNWETEEGKFIGFVEGITENIYSEKNS